MSPTVNSKGQVVYAYPYLPGTETSWGRWNYARGAGPTGNYAVTDQYLRFLVDATPRKNVDLLTFNFDRDPTTLVRARSIYDATSHDLRALKARGGKIVMWHGLADGGIMASSSIGYYEGRPPVDRVGPAGPGRRPPSARPAGPPP